MDNILYIHYKKLEEAYALSGYENAGLDIPDIQKRMRYYTSYCGPFDNGRTSTRYGVYCEGELSLTERIWDFAFDIKVDNVLLPFTCNKPLLLCTAYFLDYREFFKEIGEFIGVKNLLEKKIMCKMGVYTGNPRRYLIHYSTPVEYPKFTLIYNGGIAYVGWGNRKRIEMSVFDKFIADNSLKSVKINGIEDLTPKSNENRIDELEKLIWEPDGIMCKLEALIFTQKADDQNSGGL